MDTNAFLSVETWPQVVVVLGLLGFLSWKQWLATRSVQRTEQAMQTVKHEVTNNSGSSMKDAVDRIEATLTDHLAESRRDSERLTVVEETLRGQSREG